MKIFLVLVIISSTFYRSCCSKASDTIGSSKHSLYFELGVKAVLYSLSYDRTIPIAKD